VARAKGKADAPAPVAESVPERLSVSAWQSLVSCPYQYYARHLLKLNERDEVPEEMDKADYGSLVHRILARFHGDHPELDGVPPEALEADLRALGRQVFATAETGSYLASVWRLRWERRIPAYIDWALRRGRGGHPHPTAAANRAMGSISATYPSDAPHIHPMKGRHPATNQLVDFASSLLISN